MPELEPPLEPLAVLVGRELAAVTFVRDYFQFAFDGPCLDAFTLPTVLLAGRQFRHGEPCDHDAICDRVNRVVLRATVSEHAIALDFDDGATISISLRDADASGPEHAMFSDPPTTWMVFRVGENL